MLGTRKQLILLAVALLVSACAGRDFIRPPADTLVLGKTTRSEIINRLGPPFQEGTQKKNGKTQEIVSYSYSSGGERYKKAVIPARSMGFYFTDGVLVGHEFSSSFAADHTDFDVLEVDKIIRGRTTRSQVVDLFGPPNGIHIYPLLDEPDVQGLVYLYIEAKHHGPRLALRFYQQSLIVSVNKADVVTDVNFITVGEK